MNSDLLGNFSLTFNQLLCCFFQIVFTHLSLKKQNYLSFKQVMKVDVPKTKAYFIYLHNSPIWQVGYHPHFTDDSTETQIKGVCLTFSAEYTLQLSVQFSLSVVSNSLRPQGLQHARPPSLSITNSRSSLKLMSIESVMPSSHLILCHPLLLLPSIFPASASFPVSQFFTSGGQNIGVSASTSVLPMNIQG